MKKFSYWWTNYFWYNYKTGIILGVVGLIFVTSLIVSLVTYPTYDIVFTVAGDYLTDNLENSLNNDYNDILTDADGKGGIKVNTTVILTGNPDRTRLTQIGILQSLQTAVFIDDSTIGILNQALVEGKKDLYMFEDITEYADKYNIPQDARFYNSDGKVCAIDISSKQYMKNLIKTDSPTYLVLFMNVNQYDDEEYLTKRENAVKMLSAILEKE